MDLLNLLHDPVGRNERCPASPYGVEGPTITLPALQPFQYTQSCQTYAQAPERPSYRPLHQAEALKYSSLPPTPYQFMAGKNTMAGETRQIRKISQRRDPQEEPYGHDRKADPTAHQGQYVRSKPSIRPPSPHRARQSSKATAPAAYRPTDNSSLQVDHPRRELKKRPSSGGLPKSKEQKIKDKNSLLPISHLIRHDSRPEPIYTLSMRQQPIAARACGFGERDRRVIDPPPILELKIGDPGATTEEMKARLRYPYYVVHCSLWNADHDIDNSAMDDVGDRRNQQRRLMGTLVASPFVGKDENNVEGCFFCFPDLSCRTTGRYRLKFVLMVLDPSTMGTGNKAPFASTVISDVVTVYAAKDFPGMQSSTPLTRRLKEQGCLISVKKGIEKIGEKSGDAKDRDDSEDNDTGESCDKTAVRNKKSTKKQ